MEQNYVTVTLCIAMSYTSFGACHSQHHRAPQHAVHCHELKERSIVVCVSVSLSLSAMKKYNSVRSKSVVKHMCSVTHLNHRLKTFK